MSRRFCGHHSEASESDLAVGLFLQPTRSLRVHSDEPRRFHPPQEDWTTGAWARRAELAFSPARPCWGGAVGVWRKLTRTSLAMILLVAVACGDGSGFEAANQATTTTRPFDDTSTSAGTTTTAAATTTTDPDAVPTELIGAWRSELDDPNVGRVCLSLGARNYSINFCAHPGGGGTASVTGDTITFVSSMTMACPDGEGVYRWQIEDDRLTFTELEPPDPCVDRRDKLAVGDFTR
jgi:hypothetical protein